MTDQALAPRTNYDRLKAMVKADDVRARFTDILGERAPQFLASVLSAVATNDNLRDCDPGSILTSALKAAVLDLPIDQSIGFAWIIPYKDHGVPKAQFQIGYKGFIQLALRTSQYQAINAVEIYEGEQVKQDRLTGAIVLNGKRTGDGVSGYVAYFKLLNGFEKYLYMTVEEVQAHAKRYSKSYGSNNSPWTTNFDGMAKKTVLKSLLTHYGIMSIQMQRAIASDAPEAEPESRPLGEVIDATFTEETEELEPELVGTGESKSEQEQPLEDRIIAAAIEAKLTDNEFSAKAALKLCKTNPQTVEDALAWFRAYRGWRDIGGKPEQAAKAANNGELPK